MVKKSNHPHLPLKKKVQPIPIPAFALKGKEKNRGASE
jgi:hypothetical protein